MKFTVIFTLSLSFFFIINDFANCQNADVVNVGAIFTFDSVIGKVAKSAMEVAVSDVNSDPRILNGTTLNLIMEDASCSVFMASIRAFQVIEKEVVAIIGPQSSSVAHMITQIANSLQIPLISFAATDPTLSSLQFPYFYRTTQTDSHQMAAMAEFIDFYGWKEVIGIFIDDDYGRNGISFLEDELEKRSSKMSYKLRLPSQYNQNDIIEVLNKSIPLGPRVYVVHINPDPNLRFFLMAEKLNMMTNDYIWLSTDWLFATLDSFSLRNRSSLKVLEGVIGLRQHLPQTKRKRTCESRWNEMRKKGLVNTELNAYGFYAYDTIWAVAYALDKFLKTDGNLTFSSSDKLSEMNTSGKGIKFGKLKIFDGGKFLAKLISNINFTGLTGNVRFNSERNLISCNYEIINIVKMETRIVGYWSNYSGFSTIPQENTIESENVSRSLEDQKLGIITWPGGKTERPRGWVIGDYERPLRIGVPNRSSFSEFATEINGQKLQGYCVDVFLESRKLVPYDLPFRFMAFGDGRSNPSYDQLVKLVADDVFDGAAGDIAIVTNRTKIVDFTLPYASTGLVVVIPTNDSKSSAWVFLKPFTLKLWCVTAASFVIIAVVIWILEHRVNDDFRGPPKRQITTMLLFSFSTLFKTNQESTVSPLGKMVMVVWLFLLMVITSSYTASLTSILTVEQLSSPITGIDSLITTSLPIGYQAGSFVHTYLAESLYIHRSRLIPLENSEEYDRALKLGPKNGGVGAIVDELPYMELFLSKYKNYGIVGPSFTKSGWGFAFKRDSPLAIAFSTAILKLAESGKLQEIHESWFCKPTCPGDRIRDAEPNRLHMSSFWGLYLLCAIFALTAVLLFMLRTIRQYIRYKQKQTVASSSMTTSSSWSHVIYSFMDFIDEKEEAVKRMFKSDNPPPQPQET